MSAGLLIAGGGRSGPHVLVADVEAPELADEDRHHFERVLRVRTGDPVTVGDGAGRWRACRFAERLVPDGEPVTEVQPDPPITVGFAVVKGGRADEIVRRLTELGVDHIVPFVAARSVVRPDEPKATLMVQRWRRVAREAVMQCRRLWLPTVSTLRPFDELDLSRAALAVPGARALSAGENSLLTSPEGGWSDAELAAVDRHVGLGPHVLRAETAAVTSGAILAARRSGHLPIP